VSESALFDGDTEGIASGEGGDTEGIASGESYDEETAMTTLPISSVPAATAAMSSPTLLATAAATPATGPELDDDAPPACPALEEVAPTGSPCAEPAAADEPTIGARGSNSSGKPDASTGPRSGTGPDTSILRTEAAALAWKPCGNTIAAGNAKPETYAKARLRPRSEHRSQSFT
jgi:hypothetical protein